MPNAKKRKGCAHKSVTNLHIKNVQIKGDTRLTMIGVIKGSLRNEFACLFFSLFVFFFFADESENVLD